MVSRGGMDNRGNLDNRGMVSRGGMDNRGGVNNRGMISRGGMDYRGGMNNRGMICRSGGMVSRGRGSMVDRGRGITLSDWESSRGDSGSRSLLITTIAMYRLRSSMWLAHNRGMYSSMGLVDRVAHSRGIALLDALVVSLVSGNYGQEGGTDKSLHVVFPL